MTDSCEHTTMQAPLTTDGEVQQAPLMTEETADTAVDTAVVGVESTDVAENTDVSAVEVVEDTGDAAESGEMSNSAKDAMREAILTVGTEKMRLVGIRSVSIDDICRQLGISKKTFYVYFESKDQLVQEGIHLHERMIEAQFLEEVRGKSIIQILHEWGTIASKSEKDIEQPPPIMYDLQKYYPALCESHKAHLNKMMAKYMEQFIEEGQRYGVFRTELNAHLAAQLFAHAHHQLMEQLRLYPQQREEMLSFARQGVDIITRGILTQQGIEALQGMQSAAVAPDE